MDRFEKHLNKIVKQVLDEALENRADKIVSEIKKKSKLTGNQSTIDVAEPKGKITAADFKKLRATKKDMKEYSMGDNQIEKVEPYGDFSTDSPTEVGKVKNVGYDYEKKVANEFNEQGETDEGNAFSGALAKAKKDGKKSFKVAGKSYEVTEMTGMKDESDDSEDTKLGNFIKDALKRNSRLFSKKDKLDRMKKKTVKQDSTDIDDDYEEHMFIGEEKKENIRMTENEIVKLIERLVNEQKTNIKKKKSTVQSDFNKVEGQNKKTNNQSLKDTKEKIAKWSKDSNVEGYTTEPKHFPKGNGEMKEMDKKAYKASKAVEEYIDAFAYPGMTNLVYDEIKPNDDWIEANLKGSQKTGNATKDKDGNDLGNVVSSELGDKMYQNYKDNVYGAEQMNASYKRYPQPVDQAGESTEDGSMKLKKGSQKSEKIFKQLESTEKNEKLISEEVSRMMNIVDYNQKTQ